MSDQLRWEDEKQVFLVSNFCFQERALLKPGPETNRLIQGCLARALYWHKGVEIFGYQFVPHGFFMLVCAREMQLGDFMRDLQSPLAINLNIQLKRPKGAVFAGHYKSEALLDAQSFWTQLARIYARPCEEGWAKNVADFPGVSSRELHAAPEKIIGYYLNRKKLRALRRRDPDCPESDAYEAYSFELSPPPPFEHLDALKVDNAAEEIARRVGELTAHWQAHHAEKEREFWTPAQLAKMPWHARRTDLKSYKPAVCHSARAEKARDYEAARAQVCDAFCAAYRRHLAGHPKPCFPRGTYRPGFPRCTGAPKRGSNVAPAARRRRRGKACFVP